MANHYPTNGGSLAGRSTRWEFWKILLIQIGLSALLFGISVLMILAEFIREPGLAYLVLALGNFIIFIIGLPVMVRRYHDLDMTGLWLLIFILLGLLPLVGLITGIVNFILLGFIRGTVGRNRYGADPLLPESEEEEIQPLKHAQSRASSEDVKTRLDELKKLLEAEMISYEEYLAQRERILQDL